MKRILLVDMNSWIGHHCPYYLLYTKLLIELNYQVNVLYLGEDEIKSSAIGLGTPVLVANNTLMAERVKTYQLGYAVESTNLSAMSNALNLLLYNFCFDEMLKKNLDSHSEQSLKAKIAEII